MWVLEPHTTLQMYIAGCLFRSSCYHLPNDALHASLTRFHYVYVLMHLILVLITSPMRYIISPQMLLLIGTEF